MMIGDDKREIWPCTKKAVNPKGLNRQPSILFQFLFQFLFKFLFHFVTDAITITSWPYHDHWFMMAKQYTNGCNLEQINFKINI